MQNNTEKNEQTIDEQLRIVFRELNYFPPDYDDDYKPPSDFLADDNTLKHAFALIDETFWGTDKIAQQRVCELLRNLSLSGDGLASLICRYAFINHKPFEDKEFSEFMKEGRSYERIH